MRVVRNDLEARFAPQGYNVGINVGTAAGQTVEHVHLHLIPRYQGDVDDPRGGIRWIIPAKAEVLPIGVVPVTAIVMILRHGSLLRADVHYENGSRQQIPADSISEFVSEERKPANFRGVAAVEVFVPCPLLSSGMSLVDTPGMGSVFAGNTVITKAFVPHIDAALAVLGANPPISGDELALIEKVSAHIDDIVLVLNKAHRLTERESLEAIAIEFTRRRLTDKVARRKSRILQISASEWLNGEDLPATHWNFRPNLSESPASQDRSWSKRPTLDPICDQRPARS